MLYGRYKNDRFKNMEKMSIQILPKCCLFKRNDIPYEQNFHFKIT